MKHSSRRKKIPTDKNSVRLLLKVVHDLRKRCPWDRKQTHKSLLKYLFEESYEVAEAIQHPKRRGLQEELGDILLQVVLHSEIASERGEFTFADVARGIAEKMIYRHTHVYAEEKYKDMKSHLKNWARLKAQEKPNRSLLEEIPRSMPALQLSQRYAERAATVGFDWKNSTEVLKKVREEFGEMQDKLNGNRSSLEEELGDLFFALTNLARHLGLDAEICAKRGAEKFRYRFTKIEKIAKDRSWQLTELNSQQLDELWRSVKTATGIQ